MKQFLKRKDIVFSLQRYGIEALGAMAQGLFCRVLRNWGWIKENDLKLDL